MRLVKTEFPGLMIMEPQVLRDKRGFFLESFNRNFFAENDLPVDFVQDNHAYSLGKGVVRGLHLQMPPYTQSKLVWVTRGAVCDVVVDLRKGSPTYCKFFKIELSAKNFRRLFIPKGFAHGYETLTGESEFMYKVDAGYFPESEAGVRWNDPDLAIDWKSANPILSDKDGRLPLLGQFDSPFEF